MEALEDPQVFQHLLLQHKPVFLQHRQSNAAPAAGILAMIMLQMPAVLRTVVTTQCVH